MQKPKQQGNPNFQELIDECQEYLDYLTSEEYHEDNDREHFIFESAMEAVFGRDVWEYINANC